MMSIDELNQKDIDFVLWLFDNYPEVYLKYRKEYNKLKIQGN